MSVNITNLKNSTDFDDSEYGIERTSFLIRLLALPMICLIGFVGNSISIKMFVRKTQRTTSCCIYLAMKAISDNGFLLTLLIAWLDFVNIRVFHIEGVCQIVLFLSYLCGFMSAWAVVLVTIENYIRVCCPVKVASSCTAKIARNTVMTCFISACIIYNFPLWGAKITVLHGKAFCHTNPEFQNVQLALTYVDTILTLVVPLFIVPVLVLMTIFSSGEATRRSTRLRRAHSTARRKKISPHCAVTRLLLTVALVFLFLHTPSHIVRIKVTVEGLMRKVYTASSEDRVLQQLFLTLYYLNYSVNIFIYVFCGSRFRTTLYTSIREFSTKRRQPKVSGNSSVSIEELIRVSHSFFVGNDNVETSV
ncbi:somatostatin receptor type 4-like [Saccostrea echinata]|uniref:somatostatin receptor type 4-like n=1 Tax=Saccostrea echinata TaxID=191078 RepID=UPI002A7FF41D|nr:somatostatin receptor type 4-like [Saccostrea echinata]